MNTSVANLLSISAEPYEPAKFPTDAFGFCKIDLYFLLQFARHIGARKVVEFGYGLSSKIMKEAGLDVTSYSLSRSTAGKKYEVDPAGFVQCNVLDKERTSEILSAWQEADLVVIDCAHTWEMAKHYSEEFLNRSKKPVVIHDMTGPGKPNSYREQDYLDKFVIGKTYSVFAYTDLKKPQHKQIQAKLGNYPTKRTATLFLLPKD